MFFPIDFGKPVLWRRSPALLSSKPPEAPAISRANPAPASVRCRIIFVLRMLRLPCPAPRRFPEPRRRTNNAKAACPFPMSKGSLSSPFKTDVLRSQPNARQGRAGFAPDIDMILRAGFRWAARNPKSGAAPGKETPIEPEVRDAAKEAAGGRPSMLSGERRPAGGSFRPGGNGQKNLNSPCVSLEDCR